MMLFLWKPNETKHVGGASINYSPLSLIILSYSHGLKFVKLCLSENRLPNRLPHLLIFMFFIELAGSIWFRYPLYPSVSTIFRHQIPSQIPRHHHVARPRLGTSGQEFSGPRQWPPDHPSASCSSERPGRRGMGMDGMPWVMAFFLCFSVFSRSLKGRLKENGDFYWKKRRCPANTSLPLRDWGILRCTVDDVHALLMDGGSATNHKSMKFLGFVILKRKTINVWYRCGGP